GRVRLEADVRDIDQARRDGVLAALSEECDEIAGRRKVTVRKEVINADAPASSSPAVVNALAQSCDALGFAYQRMVSRAYHDSLFMSILVPFAELFIS